MENNRLFNFADIHSLYDVTQLEPPTITEKLPKIHTDRFLKTIIVDIRSSRSAGFDVVANNHQLAEAGSNLLDMASHGKHSLVHSATIYEDGLPHTLASFTIAINEGFDARDSLVVIVLPNDRKLCQKIRYWADIELGLCSVLVTYKTDSLISLKSSLLLSKIVYKLGSKQYHIADLSRFTSTLVVGLHSDSFFKVIPNDHPDHPSKEGRFRVLSVVANQSAGDFHQWLAYSRIQKGQDTCVRQSLLCSY
jgi:hypothetical protein